MHSVVATSVYGLQAVGDELNTLPHAGPCSELAFSA
jgi:hypothetical protein